jgi:hypothetical protein
VVKPSQGASVASPNAAAASKPALRVFTQRDGSNLEGGRGVAGEAARQAAGLHEDRGRSEPPLKLGGRSARRVRARRRHAPGCCAGGASALGSDVPLVIVLAVRVAAGTAGFRVGPSLNKNPAKEFSYWDRLVCPSDVQYEMARWTSQHEQHDSKLF